MEFKVLEKIEEQGSKLHGGRREKRTIGLGWLRRGCGDQTGISLELTNYTVSI